MAVDIDKLISDSPEVLLGGADPTPPKAKTKKVVTKAVGYDPFEDLISDVGDAPEYMTWVVYGKNGTGKTTFGASGEGTLVAEIEKDGTFSVRNSGGKAKKFKVNTWEDFEKLYWYLKDNCHKYRVLVLDTLTRLQELCIRKIVLGDKSKDADLMNEDVIKITLQQRGFIAQKMVYWLNAYNNLPIHKVWLCQEAGNSEDLDVKDYDAYPDLTRKIRIYVCSDATVIARTLIKTKEAVVDGVLKKEPVFILSTAPSEGYLIKDRTNVLGKGAINPKIEELINKVYEN